MMLRSSRSFALLATFALALLPEVCHDSPAQSLTPVGSVSSPEPAHLVVWGAELCPACKRMEPAVKRLYAEGWDVFHGDVDRQPDLAKQHRVLGRPVPVTIVIRSRVVVAVFLGPRTLDQLRDIAQSHGVGKRPAR